MSRSKQSTPSANEDHPAHKLTFVDDEIKQQLLKTPFKLLIEDENYQAQLKELRNSWKYAFVLQWLFFFRGTIKLINEPVTVDLIEEELVGLTEENLLVRIPVGLAVALIGSKVTIDDFSYRVRYLLGGSSTLLGTDDEPIEYSSLSLVDKFSLLYELILKVQETDNFRKQVERYENESELRFDSIFQKNSEESYFLLSDNRIYLQTLTQWPKIKIPKKYKYAKLTKPEEDLANIEPKLDWKVVAIGIYEIHDFLESIKSNKLMKPLFKNIKDHINDLANEDLQTRKKIIKRKREQQLHQLVSSRKRSSRLQEKEEQTKAEKERLAAEAKEERERQLKLRKQKKLKHKLNYIKKDIEEKLRRNQTSNSRTRNSTTSYIKDNINGQTKSNKDIIELEENKWLFDCVCGIKEKDYDDGTKLICCERCGRWQHLKCQDRDTQQELIRDAEEPFVCQYCKADLEVEVLAKLEQEATAKEKELEERARQRELARLQKEKEIREIEELEKLRKEELEREREKRINERREGSAFSNSEVKPELTILDASHNPLPSLATFQIQPSNPEENGNIAVAIPEESNPLKPTVPQQQETSNESISQNHQSTSSKIPPDQTSLSTSTQS
ncbi:hypothetical protein WICMUC_004522 [Wickerhamomyces mucosus]|uniref:Zinc finger PHD-type domain-containing protein n=1 Tax=Wickerhamomyces mucosus TaxID=1378264 RepID=A0A9P8PI16_9ASCO|nr:hypothetical protein WICMUC_004522 [Wickerhamomyces mucosus]